ncbi:MAG: hypothetical protein KatS3mg051_2195 [Anaerolineae bacterium]|nr:MAG: hypothetical protein KatS3mg051_2195 [Anaerolineae bacterium]
MNDVAASWASPAPLCQPGMLLTAHYTRSPPGKRNDCFQGWDSGQPSPLLADVVRFLAVASRGKISRSGRDAVPTASPHFPPQMGVCLMTGCSAVGYDGSITTPSPQEATTHGKTHQDPGHRPAGAGRGVGVIQQAARGGRAGRSAHGRGALVLCPVPFGVTLIRDGVAVGPLHPVSSPTIPGTDLAPGRSIVLA